MNWDRETASNIVTLLMLLTLILLILKRKKLGKKIEYFIAAIGVGIVIEIINTISIHLNNQFSSVTNYVIGINLVVFSLFFCYFHNLLESKKLRNLSMIFIMLFFLNYLIFAIFDKEFFTGFPFVSYFIQVALLSGSMYLVMVQTFNSDKILALGSFYPVWVCVGLMVIYLGMMPLLIVSKTAGKMMNVNLFLIITYIINIIGYVILITGTLFAENKSTMVEDETH